MRIIQIKGSNGSGKTTIVKQLILLSNDVHELVDKTGRIYATVMQDIGWTAIGKYPEDSKMGGCDTMHSIDEIKRAIQGVLRRRSMDWVVFEGMMISTIKSTFYDYLLDLNAHNPEIEPLFIILNTDVDNCIKRITGRGTRRLGLNEDNVRSKCEMIVRHAQTYDQQYVRWMYPDRLSLNDMVFEFLKLVEDKMLLKELDYA